MSRYTIVPVLVNLDDTEDGTQVIMHAVICGGIMSHHTSEASALEAKARYEEGDKRRGGRWA